MKTGYGENTTAPEARLRVLIVRLGAMGDILHALPAVQALRLAHPDWFLGWAIEPRWRALVSGSGSNMPILDRLHTVPAKSWAKSPLHPRTFHEILGLRAELRSVHYDVVVDLQGAVRSACVGRMAGAARVIGEDSPRERPARWLFRERVRTSGVHVIEQAVEVCQAVAGESLSAVRPELPRDEAAERWAEEFLATEDGIGGGRPLVVLSPGAGWGAKCWPAERYGELAALLDDAGYRVLVNSGPAEGGLAADVLQSSGGRVLAPGLSLEKLIAILRRTSLLIAGDTGPLHLACALGKPVVGIFGPTDPRRNGPFDVPSRVLRHPDSRRDHARRSQPEAGLLTIEPRQVFTAATELLRIVP